MPDLPKLRLDHPTILQPYHVELWCEKTTVNDVLESLAIEYGCNVITGAGELSQTACVNVVQRAEESGRPVRILYISDFDPAGQSMPVAVARKIEHRLYLKNLDLDIQVRPIALTADQSSNIVCRARRSKKPNGEPLPLKIATAKGATELDALEALRPGELQRNHRARDQTDISTADLDDARELHGRPRFEVLHARKDHSARSTPSTAPKSRRWNWKWKKIAKEHARQIAAWQKRTKVVWHAIDKRTARAKRQILTGSTGRSLLTATRTMIRCSTRPAAMSSRWIATTSLPRQADRAT